jgi:hypothetical protein
MPRRESVRWYSRKPLLGFGSRQYLESERIAPRVEHAAAIELEASLSEQVECSAQHLAVLPGAVRYRGAPGAVHDLRQHGVGVGCEQFPLPFASGDTEGG